MRKLSISIIGLATLCSIYINVDGNVYSDERPQKVDLKVAKAWDIPGTLNSTGRYDSKGNYKSVLVSFRLSNRTNKPYILVNKNTPITMQIFKPERMKSQKFYPRGFLIPTVENVCSGGHVKATVEAGTEMLWTNILSRIPPDPNKLPGLESLGTHRLIPTTGFYVEIGYGVSCEFIVEFILPQEAMGCRFVLHGFQAIDIDLK